MLPVVTVKGYPVLVFEKDGKKYYWLAGCPHKKRPLNEGKVIEDKIECPFHHAVFDLITGRLVREPQSKTPCTDCRLIRVKFDEKTGDAEFEGQPFIPELPGSKV
ncbi:Rieske (2Fe-2S) protein [Stygiolobus caldivivus]|uniref:(2Fe-2S)-binding protein n=1 Tax=Stygiolobus caldivivus TaxID=2824673 RepID=A0A8D5U6J8_9CREN|nr:Rieske 2Fe-2S domain-containing protein [Stygiolobus caldivivus]BCU69922.1 (2Fe-2S)-binding protein [Stygiolobus caldivivus]